jgi:hypothetical protein
LIRFCRFFDWFDYADFSIGSILPIDSIFRLPEQTSGLTFSPAHLLTFSHLTFSPLETPFRPWERSLLYFLATAARAAGIFGPAMLQWS